VHGLDRVRVRYSKVLAVGILSRVSHVRGWLSPNVGLLTHCDTLRVEVGLDVACVYTNPLKVDLVLNIRHKNEGSDDTLALRRGQLGADLAVPNVVGRCQ